MADYPFAPGPTNGVKILVPAPTGLTAIDTPAIQAAITRLTALGGNASVQFQDGTYQVDGNALVIQSLSGFSINGNGATIISLAPPRASAPYAITGNLLTIADSADFHVDNLTFDGLRDTVAPISPLTASASSGQPSVTIAAGQGARYVVGQRLQVFGGIGSADQTLSEGFVVGSNLAPTIQSITPGGGSGGGDLITFTANLAHTYSVTGGAAVSDGFGPYAWTSDYLTPYETGWQNTVATRPLSGEDQQNGLHLINCTRFVVSGVEARNVWESPIKLGTAFKPTGTLTDFCYYGTVTDCVCYHGYDQGVSVWVCNNITVKGCSINAAGWAGVSLSASDYCNVIGNQITNSVYRVPIDIASGTGIAIEGGQRNQVKGNQITTPYSDGMRILNSPLFFGLTVATSPTTSTFLAAQTAAGTSVQLSATSALQANGLYTLVDGPRSEAVTVATIVDGTHVTLGQELQFSHSAGIYLIQRIAQENVIEGNTVTGPQTGNGIWAVKAVRTVMKNNVITGWAGAGNYGIPLIFTNTGIPAAVYLAGDGSLVEGNTIGGGNATCIRANGTSAVTIKGNRLYGPSTGGSSRAIDCYGVTDSVIEGNRISDIQTSSGIQLQVGGVSGTVNCARISIIGNLIQRTNNEGIFVNVADSLIISKNIVQSCGGTAGIRLGGVTRSVISDNTCNSNKTDGIELEDSGTNFCLYNRILGNTCRDDGTGYNVGSGASWTQQNGIIESGTSNNNLFGWNEVDANAVAQLTTVGAGTVTHYNIISGVISA